MEDEIVAALLALGARLSRVGSRLMDPLGLSQQESVILLTVAARGPLSQKDIRSGLLLQRSNVSKAVARLVSLGLLTTAPGPDDARVVLVAVTPAGRRTAARCRRVYRGWNRRWLRDVDRDRLTGYLAVLAELRSRDPEEVP